MLMKLCIAAAVALGCTLVVPSASFAAGDQDKSVKTEKSKPAKHHKKAKKGFSDEAHTSPYYTGGQRPQPQGQTR
jgi:hypothetical protein